MTRRPSPPAQPSNPPPPPTSSNALPAPPITKVRPVQLSAFPDVQPDKPIGPILPSVFQGTNADLMAAVAPYYLTGSVCDLTYGEGKWWGRFKPEPFVAHDKFKLDGVDFTNLPEPDNTYDAVCFDPPYIPTSGYDTSTITLKGGGDLRGAFGLVGQISQSQLNDMVQGGMSEAVRVAKPNGWVLVKCMDFVNGSALTLGHVDVIKAADALGCSRWDLIVHHTGSGPGGHNIFDPKRARRHHSYLLVFRKAQRLISPAALSVEKIGTTDPAAVRGAHLTGLYQKCPDCQCDHICARDGKPIVGGDR